MKIKYTIAIILFTISTSSYSQTQPPSSSSSYYQVVEGSPNSKKSRAVLSSEVDANWDKWKLRGYSFGFDPQLTPMYTTINGILSTPYMVQVRGNSIEKNKKRWGFHVFEGYATDDKSRITMLVNKHVEEGKPVAEMYYYGTEYNHSDVAYNWFRIGSDVRQHSFMFSRDMAIFYGTLKLKNALTLGRLGQDDLLADEPAGDAEQDFEESAKHVNYKSLKNAEDGTIFYDKDHDIVVIKMKGEWRKLATEPLPESINYEF